MWRIVLLRSLVAKYLGIDDDKIKAAVANFKGVKRRFEYVLKNDHYTLIDDYAHHPEELRGIDKWSEKFICK
jgi:UDP-N-acetylmuramate--alanine ligase